MPCVVLDKWWTGTQEHLMERLPCTSVELVKARTWLEL